LRKQIFLTDVQGKDNFFTNIKNQKPNPEQGFNNNSPDSNESGLYCGISFYNPGSGLNSKAWVVEPIQGSAEIAFCSPGFTRRY
jgi:hypothetical protein